MRYVNFAAAERISKPVLSTAVLSVFLWACSSSSSDDPPAEVDDNEPAPPVTQDDSELPPRSSSAVSLDQLDVIGTTYWADGTHTSMGGQGGEVNGLPCQGFSPGPYHVHAHLSIFLNGEALTIPGGIGFLDLSGDEDCHYPMHTHDSTGMLHMHAEEPTDFTLGQFFDIWGRPISRDNVADFVQMPIRFFVTDEDNVVTEYLDDPADILLPSHREVTIVIGTEIDEIPHYTWEGD